MLEPAIPAVSTEGHCPMSRAEYLAVDDKGKYKAATDRVDNARATLEKMRLDSEPDYEISLSRVKPHLTPIYHSVYSQYLCSVHI